jgi:hypothetical protein
MPEYEERFRVFVKPELFDNCLWRYGWERIGSLGGVEFRLSRFEERAEVVLLASRSLSATEHGICVRSPASAARGKGRETRRSGRG